MSYALFAQRKLVVTGELNCLSLQQTQRSNEQYLLATDTLSLQQQMTSLQASQSTELAELYADLASYSGTEQRSSINALINEKEEEQLIVFEVKVAEADMGRIIGKQGRTASSIRTIMKAVASREGKKISVEFMD